MNEHAKLNRLLSLIILLLGPRKYTREEIQERFDISKSSFHRYIKSFRACGIWVAQNNGLYHIIKIEPEFKEISELLHFSEEEAIILNHAISSIDDNNLMKTNLRKKLYSLYDFDRIPQKIITHPTHAHHIQTLIQSIKQKNQITLLQYQSAHGQRSEDRLVEAFSFTINYQMIWAFDLKTKECRQFKVSRMRSIRIEESDWRYEEQHQAKPNDAFRMSGEKAEYCELKLSLRARNLLMEEYPLAIKHITKQEDGSFIFRDKIYSYLGVGRFCMGLAKEIEIIKPLGLKTYIQNCLQKYLEKNTEVSLVGTLE